MKDQLEQAIADEKKKLERINRCIVQNLRNAPEGSLRVQNLHGKYKQYYCYTPKQRSKYKNGKYISKSDSELIKKLAQKDYDIKFAEFMKKRYSTVCKFEEQLRQSEMGNIPQPGTLKEFITPWIEDDNTYTERWYKEHPGSMNQYPIADAHYTSSGIAMRSKSEVMIAELLDKIGIPFAYETEIILNNHKKYPDFCLLNLSKRKTVYLEHFGMMDNPEYADSNIAKLQEYLSSGMRLGDNLLVSFETSTQYINIQFLEKMLRDYLC